MPDAHGPKLDRRTIVRTAAWGVPVATVVAASPAFARSVTPGCPANIGPSGGVFAANATVLGGTGTLGLAGGFGIDATGLSTSLFNDAFTFVVDQVSVTMSNDQTYTSIIGGGATAGTTDLVVAMPAGFAVTGVPFPNGLYGVTQNFRPTAVTARVTMTFGTLIPLGSITCTYDMTWSVSNAIGAGPVGAGAGNVTYGGTVTAGGSSLVS